MAPKKKAKTVAPPLGCFAGAKITVIGAKPFQRKIWEPKIGAGAVFLKPSQAASLKEGNDFVVIAVENVDQATVRAKAGAAQLVVERWLTDSIARNERQSAAAHAWGVVEAEPEAAPQAQRNSEGRYSDEEGGDVQGGVESDEEEDVLAKFGCQRRVAEEDNKNKELTDVLGKTVVMWSVCGAVAGDAQLRVRAGSTVAGLLRSWPVQLTPANVDEELKKLTRQHSVSAFADTPSGEVLALVESLVKGDASSDLVVPGLTGLQTSTCKALVEIAALKLRISRDQALKLVTEHNVKGARDLVDRRRDLPISDVLRRKLELAPCGSDAYPNSNIPMEVQETKQIHGILESAARFIGLHMTVVGSWRRGKVGGHDVDVIIHAPLDGPLIDARAYAFESPTGLGNELMARFFKAIDQFGPPGFLHPDQQNGVGSSLGTTISFCVSPRVQRAVRQLSVTLAPTATYAHSLLSLSGSPGFVRSFKEYIKKAHECSWMHVPDEQPIVGRVGWELSPAGDKLERVAERVRAADEHWAWSKDGIYLVVGARDGRGTKRYVEDNESLRTEKDVFNFFHLEYLEPQEREC